MTTFVAAQKRGRTETNGNFGGPNRVKAMSSFQSGMEIKSKPCNKFLSGAGCPFGDGCRYLHTLPVGFNPILQMMNMINPALPSILPMGHPAMPGAAVKTRICNRFSTPEGCKFGDRCNFAHGDHELGNPVLTSNDDHGMTPPLMGRLMGHPDHHFTPALGGFGASATAKISVDASLAGGIIGKGGCNTKEITRRTGAKLCIRDQESDANVKYIEMEGSFDQIICASNMVKELIATILPMQGNILGGGASGAAVNNNFKTKLCEKFANGACPFGDRCNFAHGEDELRNNGASDDQSV